jgi:hypothetical protein
MAAVNIMAVGRGKVATLAAVAFTISLWPLATSLNLLEL